jgi:hypothetical protein
MSICAMRPTSSDARLKEVGRNRLDRCVLPCQRPFVVCQGAWEKADLYTFRRHCRYRLLCQCTL